MAEDADRETQLRHLAHLKALGEQAYNDMYEAHSSSGVGACYSEVKECFYDAIRLARTLGLTEEVAALEERLNHIKAVFRSQFAG
jgi:hypothetical protein